MRLFIFSHAQDLESICIKFIKYRRYYLTSFSDVSIETVLLISIKITDFTHPNIFITYRIIRLWKFVIKIVMSKFVCIWLKHFLHGIYILISSVIWHEFRHVPSNYDHDIPFDCFNPQKMAMFGGYYFLLLKQTTINVLLFLDSRKQFINI